MMEYHHYQTPENHLNANMLLPSQNSQFLFLLPYALFPQEIEEKYAKYLKKNRLHYASIADYINSQIKSVSLPGITLQLSEQLRPNGKKQSFKGATHEHNLGGNSFTIAFKDADAHMVYMIMQDVLTELNRDTELIWLPTISYYILDMYGDAIYKIDFVEAIMKGVAGMTYSYPDQKVDAKDFSLEFHYNGIEIYYVLEESMELPAILMLDQTWGEIQEDKPREI